MKTREFFLNKGQKFTARLLFTTFLTPTLQMPPLQLRAGSAPADKRANLPTNGLQGEALHPQPPNGFGPVLEGFDWDKIKRAFGKLLTSKERYADRGRRNGQRMVPLQVLIIVLFHN